MKSKLELETSNLNDVKSQVQQKSLEIEAQKTAMIEKGLEIKELQLALEKRNVDIEQQMEVTERMNYVSFILVYLKIVAFLVIRQEYYILSFSIFLLFSLFEDRGL